MKLADRVVMDVDKAINVLEAEPTIAFDLETTGLNPWKDRTVVIGMHAPSQKTSVVIHNPTDVPFDDRFINFLSSPLPDGSRREYVTHNGATFDILFIANAGMDVRAVDWWDTLISEQVSITTDRRNVSVSLEKTFERRLGQSHKLKVDHKAWTNPWLTQAQIDYITSDIKHLHAVRDAQLADCQDSRGKALRMEMELLPTVVKMSMRGLPIDLYQLQEYLKGQEQAAKDAKVYLFEELGQINFNSPIQIKKAFGNLGFNLTDTKAETLEDLQLLYAGEHLGELSKQLLIHRHANQRIKVYNDEWIDKWVSYDPSFGASFIHPRFKQVSTDTGRFSAADPAIQQCPQDMRKVFGHVPGYKIVSVDYAAIEVRVAAALANDETMIAAFQKQDIHTYVASLLFNKPESDIDKKGKERQVAKAATFTLLFGGGPRPLIKAAKKSGVALRMTEANSIISSFFTIFEGLRRMREEAYLIANCGGSRVLNLPTGLQRVLYGDKLTPQRILNTLVQGTAAAFMKKALLNSAKTPYKGSLMLDDLYIATLHDEIVALVPEDDAEMVKELMTHVMIEAAYEVLQSRRVPIDAEGVVGDFWQK